MNSNKGIKVVLFISLIAIISIMCFIIIPKFMDKEEQPTPTVVATVKQTTEVVEETTEHVTEEVTVDEDTTEETTTSATIEPSNETVQLKNWSLSQVVLRDIEDDPGYDLGGTITGTVWNGLLGLVRESQYYQTPAQYINAEMEPDPRELEIVKQVQANVGAEMDNLSVQQIVDMYVNCYIYSPLGMGDNNITFNVNKEMNQVELLFTGMKKIFPERPTLADDCIFFAVDMTTGEFLPYDLWIEYDMILSEKMEEVSN